MSKAHSNNKALNVLFLEAEHPVANFISRRMHYLVQSQRVQVTILVHLNQPENLPYGVRPIFKILVKESPALAMRRLISTFPGFLFRMRKIFPYAPAHHGFLKKLNWALVYNEVATCSYDVLHVQYIGQVGPVQWISKYTGAPIMASVRGAQVTHMVETNPAYAEVIRNGFQQCQRIHCVSQSLAERCLSLGAPRDKLLVNYNGIDPAVFAPPPQKDYRNEVLHCITVGSLIWRKGIVFQLLVLSHLAKKHPQKKVNLIIIGEGPEREQLLYYAVKLGVSSSLRLAGQMKETQIIEELQKAHLYLTTSVAEGLSNSVMEALSCGLPVLSFQCEGAEELITSNQNGQVIGFGEVETLAEQIAVLYADRAMLEQWSVNARNKMVASFDIHQKVEEMTGVYQQLAASW